MPERSTERAKVTRAKPHVFRWSGRWCYGSPSKIVANHSAPTIAGLRERILACPACQEAMNR